MTGRTTAQFEIDQTLHGYRQGHRWLTGSVRFEGETEATLLALTDLLTQDLDAKESSYLSGFPLKAANKYALTRTWAAHEAHRPGSVWSHSLVLDYAALTLLDDPTTLLPLFRRPDGGPDQGYQHRIPSTDLGSGLTQRGKLPPRDFEQRAIEALQQIYGSQARRTISLQADTEEDDEALSLEIWRQMWPGLRRDFAFFTRVRGEVPEVSANCILQFRTDWQGGASLSDPGPELKAFHILADDLRLPGPTELRRYLGRYAFDAKEPRRAVPALVLMHESRSDPARVAAELATRFAPGTAPARLKRDVLLQVTNSDDVTRVADVISAFKNDPIAATADEIKQLANSSLMRSATSIATLLQSTYPSSPGELGDAVMHAITENSPIAELAAANMTAEMRLRALHLRPQLADSEVFWANADGQRAELLENALQIVPHPVGLILALGSHITAREAERILGRFGEDAELALFERARASLPERDAWSIVQILARRPGFLVRESFSERPVGLSVLDAILSTLSPHLQFQPEVVGRWFQRERPTSSAIATAPYFAVVATTTAITVPPPLSTVLLIATFDAVYRGLERWSLPGSAREFVEAQIGRRSKEWRLVDKLVAALVDYYGGPADVHQDVLLVTQNSDAIKDIVARVDDKGGKGALDRLLLRLENDQRPALDTQRSYVRTVIKQRNSAKWFW